MNFLVTGGAGFIGSNLVEGLLKKGFFVRVIDDFSTGKRENLSAFEKDIELIERDIRNSNLLENAVKDIDVILHQAALPSVPRSITDPILTNDVNINGTLNVLYAAKNNGVKRVVFASSSSVYGDTIELPKHESMMSDPLSPYAVTKLTGEKYFRVFSSVYGLETVVLRYFNVFGPRQNPESEYSAVIPKFIKAILNDEQPTIYGDGTQSRDFTYIDNVVNGNILAATAENIPGGIIMNCACASQITLNQLVEEINKILGKKIDPIYSEPRQGDIKHSFADITLAQKIINYQPEINFEEGLKKTINYYRTNIS